MPEAVPSSSGDSRKSNRRGKHDYTSTLSQGYPIRLEPVPEHIGSEAHFSEPHLYANNHTVGHSSSSSGDEYSGESSQLLVFPSAMATPDYGSTTEKSRGRKESKSKKKQRQTALESLSDSWEMESTVFRNEAMLNGFDGDHDDAPVRQLERSADYRKNVTPRQEWKFLRQEARELEIAKQKELMRKRQEEEERRKFEEKQQRAALIARSYSSSRGLGSDSVPAHVRQDSGRGVRSVAAKFEAQAQLIAETSQSSQGWSPALANKQQSRQPAMGSEMNPEEMLAHFDQVTTL